MLKTDLPEPGIELREHSARVVEHLRCRIEREGPLSFEQYMETVLYAPGLGYYSAGLRKFGWGGDFVTAPELGSLYAECVAEAIAPLLRSLPYACILEVGAGTGAFAADLWLALERLKALPERYWILERSADLRERQIERIQHRAPQAGPRVAWLEAPPKEGFSGVVFGNEVIDALPCARFEWQPEAVYEWGVGLDGRGQLSEVRLPARPALVDAVLELHATHGADWTAGYSSEVHLSLQPWLQTVTAALREGVALFVDYGYPAAELYAAERARGTLVGHYRHRWLDDPYWYPGLVDWSASVDFTALAVAADRLHMQVAGFSSQLQFLLAAGLPQRLHEGVRNEREQLRRNEEARRLTLPGEMGERFKAMSLVRGLELHALPEALRLPHELHRL